MDRLTEQLVAALRRQMAGGRPAVPEGGRLLWSIFAELCTGRTYHLAVPNPITHAEIDAWSRLTRWPLEVRHLALLRALDDAWLDIARSGKGGALPAVQPKQPLTPEAFDAVFG